MDTDKNTDKNTDKDTDKVTDKVMGKDTDKDMTRTWTRTQTRTRTRIPRRTRTQTRNTFVTWYISICRCSPYSAVWITCDTSQCKFQGAIAIRATYVQLFEINSSYPEFYMRWRPHLKGLSHESRWAKQAEKLDASPFKSDLWIDTTFNQQSL